MDYNAKKNCTAYDSDGLKVMAAEDQDGHIPTGTLNWITQVSFEPPMVELDLKTESLVHDIIKTARYFAFNVLGNDQHGAAYTILKSDERDCQKYSREALHSSSKSAPVLDNTPTIVESGLLTTVEEGEFSIFIGEVLDAGANQEPEGHGDEVTLFLKDLGVKTFCNRCRDFII